MPNKFHSLLASASKPSLIAELNLPGNQERELVEAAREISRALKQGFTVLREDVRRGQLPYEVPKPQFAIQGSYIYGTLNAPAYPPIQQVDIDLGMYLPFSALGDGERPKTVASYYFDTVTNILSAYIKDNNKSWKLPSEERQKDTCIRVVISDTAHIDIPLYGVPDLDLDRVTEAQVALNQQQYDELPEFIRDDNLFLKAAVLDAVDPTVIHIADRKKGWLASDALAVRDWVTSNFRAMGKMIRPTNRFLKAWRDEKWQQGNGPSSIFILAHCVRSFPRDREGMTHCDVLETVINTLPNVFDQPLLIPCPKPGNKDYKEDLRERVKPNEKVEFIEAFQELKADYAKARRNDIVSANQILVSIFGDRMPNDPSRIEFVDEIAAAVSGIQAAKPEVKPLYTTDRSNSG